VANKTVKMNKYKNLHELFFTELKNITYFGNKVKSNNNKQTEVLFRSFELIDPTNINIEFSSRKFNINYAVMEFLWYISKNKNVKNIGKCANIWLKIKDKNNEVESNYGTFLLGEQWDWIKKELKNDKDSRRCTIVINQPYHKNKNKLDIPCTQYIQIFIRDNKLHLGVNMRSNDIIYGLCNDIFNFCLFQQLILNELLEIYPDLKLGSYFHNAGSLHLYEIHYKMRDKILKNNKKLKLNKKFILKSKITCEYINTKNIYLPKKNMSKKELIIFTNNQIKKLFI